MGRLMTSAAVGCLLALMPRANLATAAGTFDGTYAGPQKETRNNNTGYCQNINRNTQVVVQAGVIKYKWGVPLETTVAADGSFSVDVQGMAMRGASASISFKGRITGPGLEADVGSAQCAAHLSLKKM